MLSGLEPGVFTIRDTRLFSVLGGAALVLLAIAWCRGGEYDEFYSVFLIAGQPRPDWPVLPFTAAASRHFYHGHANLAQIAGDLRRYDVHPPLYFWLLSLWRRVSGSSLFALRTLSVIETLGALALLGRSAGRIGVSAPLAVVLSGLCYGFAYSGIVARDFALSTLCVMAGTCLLIEAEQRGRWRAALAGGLALGAACFSNYLASFTTIALLGWITIIAWRRPRIWLAAVGGAAAFIPAGLWFFRAQAATRHGQFSRFHLFAALIGLARDQAGAIIGALPRDLPPPWSLLLAGGLALLLALVAGIAITRGLPRLQPRYRLLIGAGVMAPPIGLLVLGGTFDTMPIEMRYVWLGLPFAGLALAAGLRDRKVPLAVLLVIQGVAIVSLAIAPATMQPADRMALAAARLAGPGTLVIVPFGNDGVGIPGPFIAAAPPAMHLLVARHADRAILAEAARFRRVAIARIMVDGASRGLVPRLDQLFKAGSCWHSAAAPHGLAVFANTCREE